MPHENAGNAFLNYIASQENFQFLKIVTSYHIAPNDQRKKWEEFLLDIWFLQHDLEIYENLLIKNKIYTQIEHQEIKKLHDRMVDIFQENRDVVIDILLLHEDFIAFAQKSAHLAGKNRIAEVACEYIYATFMSLFMDYEVRRISQKIFYIQQ